MANLGDGIVAQKPTSAEVDAKAVELWNACHAPGAHIDGMSGWESSETMTLARMIALVALGVR